MNHYIVTYTKELRTVFVVAAETSEEAEREILDNPDSEDGLVDEYIHQATAESRLATEDDEKNYGPFDEQDD